MPDFTDKDYKKNVLLLAGEMVSFFRSRNISFFITGGTALGFLRENDLIVHDNDFDFGVLYENWKEEYDKDLRSAFKVEAYFPPGKGVRLPNQYGIRKPGSVVDLYLFYKGMGKKFKGPSRYMFHFTGYGIYEHKAETIERIKPAKFCGLDVNIPSDIETFVKDLYGDDWKIPKKKDELYNDFSYCNYVKIL